MASKSFGQIAGTVVGAAVGFFAGGNVALGASIGGMIGGMIDPPKGPTVVGPRLDDLSFQTSTLGAPLGRAYGTVPVLGNVVWLEGDKYREVITSEEQGGKGGPTSTYETAHYYATFAVSLLRVTDATKTVALRRLWIGSNLVYEAGSDNLESIIASNSQSALFTFYSGSDDQQPNTRWQADKGANAVSGFPGRCYIVIYDLDLEPYSRSLAMAQVKVELAFSTQEIVTEKVGDLPLAISSDSSIPGSIISSKTQVDYALLTYQDWYQNPVAIETFVYRPMESSSRISKRILNDISWSYGVRIAMRQCNILCSGYMEGFGSPFSTGNRFNLILENETIRSDVLGVGVIDYLNLLAAVESNTDSIYESEIYTWLVSYEYGGHLCLFKNGIFSGKSLNTVRACDIGYSNNFVFCLIFDGVGNASTTVKRFDKETLVVDTTYSSATANVLHISVVSDDLFFLTTVNGDVIPWRSGVEYPSLGDIAALPAGTNFTGNYQFSIFNESPFYASTVIISGGIIPQSSEYHVSYDAVLASVAKLREIVTSECSLAGIAASDIELGELTNSDVRGYRVASAGSIRSSLEMLQAAFPFDVAPSGYKLRFVSRGGTTLATIPETDLGAVASGDSFPVLLPMAREMDTQIPYKVSVRYLDPAREYDIGEQYASRPDTASVSERTVELSLVLTGDEAAQAADVLNQKDWIERTSFGPFTLPPTWNELEPPDVVTVEHRGQAHVLRLTRAETLPDGRIVCSGAKSSAQSYTSTAAAQESLTIGQSLVPLKGTTQGYLLDIPRIRSEQDVPGMSFAMTGLASGWPGGVLLRSDDSSNSWPAVGAMNARAKVFTAGAALSAHHGYSIDHGSVLTVTPSYSGHTLSSVTEDQLYGHANLAAYGADGRWEIVAFRTVTDNTGSYTLKDFLRGLYGTEQYTGTHAVGDYLIMLDTDAVSFFGLPTTAIGSQRLYRAVTQGYAIESAVDIVDTYGAVNLKPLAPVDFKADRGQSSLDFMLSGSRRSRMPVELFSGFGVPVGESAEAYEIEIYDSGFNSLKRTISGLTTLEATYESGDQVTDFGSEIETVYGRSYQISSVIGRGFVSQFQIYRPLKFDPFAASVVLGLHFNGTNGGTSFHEVTGKTMSVAGVTTSTLHSVFGGASAYFSGSSSLGVAGGTDLVIGTSDVSIDFWFKRTIDMGSNTFRIINNWDGTGYMVIVTNNKLRAYINNGTVFDLTGTTTIANDTWYYGEFVRSGANLYLFLNGSLEASSTTFSGSITAPQTDTLIGKATDGNFQYWEGYIDDLRVTKEARNTSGYAVPSQQFIDP